MLARNLNVVEEDLSVLANFGKKVLLNSAGVYATTFLPDMTNNMSGMVQRNLTRGFYWYLADEVANELATGNSNFTDFTDMSTLSSGVKNAVDDTIFYGLTSAVVEQTRVDVPVVQTINSVVGNPTLSENLALGLMLTTTQMVGQHLERAGWDAITNLTKRIGL